MNRTKNIHAAVAVAALILGSATAIAHNGIEHVMGTVKTITETSIIVETVKHEIKTIALDPATTFTNKGVKATWKDLKIAARVAVDVKDDAHDKAHAVSVKWGASSTTPAQKTDHKTDPKMKM